jgi:hypothetical protein
MGITVTAALLASLAIDTSVSFRMNHIRGLYSELWQKSGP